MLIPIIGAAFKSEADDANQQRCLNMFPVTTGVNSRGNYALVPTPGLYELIDLGGATCRAILTVNDFVYVVVDNTVFKLSINVGARTVDSSASIGTLQTSTGVVEWAVNPTQIMLVDGSATGYIITIATDTLVNITDGDFQGGKSVTYIDGYFLYSEPETAVLRTSALNDGLVWDPLDVATCENSPDLLVTLAKHRGEIWCLGTDSVECWFDNANPSGLPLSPRVGSVIDTGCAAQESVVEFDSNLWWLDSHGRIVESLISAYMRAQSSGNALTVKSDSALQAEIASYDTISDAIAMSYMDNGRSMYQITFPSARKTWCMDRNGKEGWFEKGTFSEYDGRVIEHLAQYSTILDNTNVVCGINSGKVYLMGHEFFDDAGIPISRIRTTGPISYENKLITINELWLRLGAGKATSSGLGSDPQIAMRYSNDGGHTWSNSVSRSMGKIGEYALPVTWNRLGTEREWVFEFTVVEPIEFSIIEAAIEVEIENSLQQQSASGGQA